MTFKAAEPQVKRKNKQDKKLIVSTLCHAYLQQLLTNNAMECVERIKIRIMR